jgi:hypothetical protein
MAMKVTKEAIHRLSVSMSCGCTMYAEFKDAQCKEPVADVGEGDLDKVFNSCPKHEAQDVIEFIIGERLEEAIEDAQKTPVAPVHMYDLPGATSSSDGSITGDSVRSVAKVNRPAAVKPREKQDPLAVKTRQRSSEELRATGALMGTGEAAPNMFDEADEEPVITDNLEELFNAVGGEPAEG